jgi:DNA polymerase
VPDAGSPEDLRELRELTLALRAHVEWQRDTGSSGFDVAAAAATAAAVLPAVASTAAAPAPVAAPISAPVSTPASVPADAAQRLAQLAVTVSTCQKCVLCQKRKQTVFARGTGSCGVCFVGEGPGADEDAQGFPFVGKAGQLLDKMIEAMGWGRDEVYVCNVVKCRPPDNRKPEPDEMAACLPYLAEQLELVRPSVIVALGATAVQGLLGTSGGIMRLRGNWKTYRGIPLMPTFHPAYLLRTPSAKRQVWEDLQEVLKRIGREVPARR